MRACQKYPVKQLVVAGGVAANQGLREKLTKEVQAQLPDMVLTFPPLRLCGDNAAMIGAAAHVALAKGQLAHLDLNANPSLVFPNKKD